MKVWLARDYKSYYIKMFWNGKKPVLMHGRYKPRSKSLQYLCRERFETLTGFRLKPGACARVEIKVKRVK